MRLLTRYLLMEVGKGYVIAALSLTALFLIFGLVREIDNLGEGNYRLHHAGWYVGMTGFSRLLELLPFVAFFGGLLALANLARRHEMIIMSTSGLSIMHAVRASALAAALLGLLALVLAQWVAPPLYKQAELQRMLLKSGRAELLQGGGFWVRGDHWYLKADRLGAGKDPESVLVLEFHPSGPLRAYQRAERAEIMESGRWLLYDVERHSFGDTHRSSGDTHVSVSYQAVREWTPPSATTAQSGTASESVRADAPGRIQPLPLASLSLSQLSARVAALRVDNLPADDARLLFWQRLIAPLAVLAMGLLTVPIVYGDLRTGGFGLRLAIGSGVGIGAWLLGNFMASGALLIDLPTLVSAALPTVLVGGAAGLGIRSLGHRV